MRYIGNKINLLDFIFSVVEKNNINENIFCDIFSGTTNVAKFFKKKGYRIITNDFMAFSYVFQRAYIQNNEIPKFPGLAKIIQNPSLQKVIDYLNNLAGREGFIFHNFAKEGTKNKKYQRNYFSSNNAKKIDAIRETIQEWLVKKLITEDEFYILLASLLEAIPFVSNTAGTYGAFLKSDDPRKFKKLTLEIPDIIVHGKGHFSYKEDGNILIKNIKCGILYIDPPYNTRQYAPNYHVLETVAVWDKRLKDSKSGLRPYDNQKSLFCSKHSCIRAFEDLIMNANCKHILFSYNTEGIIPYDEIMRILSKKGKVKVYRQGYRRYKSNSNGEQEKDNLSELVFYCSVKN